MSSVRFLCSFNTLIKNSATWKPYLIGCCRNSNKNFSAKSENNGQLTNDIVLFSFDYKRQIYAMNAFGIVQCICWCHYGWYLMTKEVAERVTESNKFLDWFKKSDKNRNFWGLTSIACGILFYTIIIIYSKRLVRCLTLHKGGRTVTIETYRVLGLQNVTQVPISEVSAMQSRKKAKVYLPLKVKNRSFYYLLDMNGQFHNKAIFDYSAGICRNF